MQKKVFIPLTDEIMYDHPEWISGPVIPYEAGQECHHWLAVELNPEDNVPAPATVARAVVTTKSRSTKSPPASVLKVVNA